MSTFTPTDLRGFNEMLKHQFVVDRRNKLIEKAPHIGTNTYIEIGRCIDEYNYEDPIYVPAADDSQAETRELVREFAIYTKWEFEGDACNKAITCNPYYPKNAKCVNMNEKNPIAVDSPFSYRIREGRDQKIDVCQPMCYEPGATEDNFMGLYTRYTYDTDRFKDNNGKCFLSDPLLLAYYLDPTRRVVDQEKEVIEKYPFDIVTRTMGNPPQPVVVAKIPSDYCEQFGLERVADEQTIYGETVYSCKPDNSVASLSSVAGNVLSRAVHIGVDEFIEKVKVKRIADNDRYPPSRQFLANREMWMNNIKSYKKPLPFPLKSSDLGIILGTNTEWLIWTDQYDYKGDQLNDMYGGRLVERARPIPFAIKTNITFKRKIFNSNKRKKNSVDLKVITSNSAAAVAATSSSSPFSVDGRNKISKGDVNNLNIKNNNRDGKDIKTGTRMRRQVAEVDDGDKRITGSGDEVKRDSTNSTEHLAKVYKSLHTSINEYRDIAYSKGLKETIFSSDGIINSTVNQLSTQGLMDSYSKYTNESAKMAELMKTSLVKGEKVFTETLGYTLANAAISTTVEKSIFTRIASSLKSFIKLPATIAGILQMIGFIGFAVDLFSDLVYDPLNRYNHYFNDKTLSHLARAELDYNIKNLGVNRVIVTPYEWVINTPYHSNDDDLVAHMKVMPSILQARSLNSNGSVIKRDIYNYVIVKDGSDSIEFITKKSDGPDGDDEDPVVKIKDSSTVIDALSNSLNDMVRGLYNNNDVTKNLFKTFNSHYTDSPVLSYYVLFLFITICIASLLERNSKNNESKYSIMFSFVIFLTVTSIVLPLNLVSSLTSLQP